MVLLCEPMRFITNRLAETKTGMMTAEFQRFLDSIDEEDLLLLGQSDDPRRLYFQSSEDLQGRIELTTTSIDENDIGVQFMALPRFAIPSGYDFTHCLVVVIRRRPDLVAAIPIPPWSTIDETDLRADRLAATEVCNVDGLHASHWIVELKNLLK